jgi:hypothetical protein
LLLRFVYVLTNFFGSSYDSIIKYCYLYIGAESTMEWLSPCEPPLSPCFALYGVYFLLPEIREQMGLHSLKRLFVIAILVAIALGMFSQVVNAPLIRDEHMFVTAGVLIQKNALYRDFAYLQTPYLPACYALMYKLSGTTHFLLWGRVLTFIAVVVSTLLVYLICHRLSKSLLVALACLLLFALNQTMYVTMPYAWNHALPIAFSLIAFHLFVLSVSETSIKRLGLVLSGIFVGAAIGTKLTYAYYLLPLLVIALLYPASIALKTRVLNVLSPAFAGVILGSSPMLVFLARTGFDIFWFDNLGYHFVNSAWRAAADYKLAMSFAAKVNYVRQLLAQPSNLALCLTAAFLLLSSLVHLKDRTVSFRQLARLELVFSLLLAISAIIVAFQPTPLWPMYFTMPLPFVVILIGSCYTITPSSYTREVRILLMCSSVATVIFSGPQLFKHLQDLTDLNRWAPVSVHDTAQRLRRHISDTDDKQRVATLSPVYALEAGLPIYYDLATGAFLYRVGDLIPAMKRDVYRGISPDSLRSLLEKEPPAGILVGFEDDLDIPFIRYAEAHGCRKIDEDFNGGTLYVCPQEQQKTVSAPK